MIGSDHGHGTLTAMVTVLLLSLLFLSAATVVYRGINEMKDYTDSLQRYTDMNEIARDVWQQLNADPTPESHSPNDPVWNFVKTYNGLYALEFHDVSSRLNPNWMRTALFEHTKLKNLIVSGEMPDQIRDRRLEIGFVANPGIWEETFGVNNLNRFFTIYSNANVNVTYEASLEELYRLRVSDAGAEAFRGRIQKGLMDGKIWSRDELHDLLGLEAGKLYPVVNAEPLMNVHFIDSFLLECLLSYPYRQEPLENPGLIAQTILEKRNSVEILPEDLRRIIQPNENQLRVLEYLGTRTSVFVLTVSQGDYRQSFHYSYIEGGWTWR